MRKTSKFKLLTVFCLVFVIVSLGVHTLISTHDDEAPAQPHYILYTEIVPPIYDKVHYFHNGYAVVMIGNAWNNERGNWGSFFSRLN